MARNLLLVLFAVATLLHGSAAQTRHMVGDATGWIIPAGGAATYTAWASNKTFTVNDTLVFNFATGQHNVAKVTKSAFDACNGGSAVFTLTSGPATVTLNETGEQYYICSVGSHCSAGQKLAINVNRASSTGPSPAPQPRGSGSPPRASPVPTQAPQASSPTPPPRSAPAPAFGPSSEPATFIVGETAGWIVPGNASFYTAWASGKNFRVGDVLVFNYASNTHNVEEVTKANFDACSSASPIATFTTPPARVTLNKSGQHFFICGIPGHCLGGQKLAINVTGSSTATPPSAAAPPTTPSSPSPAGAVTPPPQNSGAASLGVVGVFATLLSVAATFFY
ncbi:hypothetical protein GLYMA_13G158200v4 [Glycine max]|uniref:Phytocyanin domain-containing protein n=3 Tax=Glycine subgen. Soja TaxID=1462606 RepID=A0A0R0GP18_SOYBN|nr:blue copper protein-like [Glycine soja]KAG4970733.1 hypothetical protein JHK85_037154 [Glycine max]KAG4959710.1 hypothetical protein JHK87_036343 [Glycine soja]KAH1101761.1 hypothetical protein GYH30_036369 [Glycine max]KRH20128.1 hypothetical protein GLYMA_13G158200v4 [Glycine max]RZB81270.1 Stellacyanin [Glycine soja]|eukprot:XP_003542629.1 blue copper protein [Glycine max]